MPKLIKDGEIVDDSFFLVEAQESDGLTLPPAATLVKLSVWHKYRDALISHPYPKGVQLAPDEFAESIADDLERLDLIAIEFPMFTDGRGYSTAAALRDRYGFRGELRAVGDIFKDTLFYQQRCGFNSFSVRPDQNIADALQGLKTFSISYQGAADSPPLFRVRPPA